MSNAPIVINESDDSNSGFPDGNNGHTSTVGGRSLRTRRQSCKPSNATASGSGAASEMTGRLANRLKSTYTDDFVPEESTRERRKQTRKTTMAASVKNSILNDKGHYRATGVDACDCLDNSCVGCHFPCPQCGSGKCGPVCRVNRKWVVNTIEHDGKVLNLTNLNLKS